MGHSWNVWNIISISFTWTWQLPDKDCSTTALWTAGCSVHCRMAGSSPGFLALGASCTHHTWWTPKLFIQNQMSHRVQITLLITSGSITSVVVQTSSAIRVDSNIIQKIVSVVEHALEQLLVHSTIAGLKSSCHYSLKLSYSTSRVNAASNSVVWVADGGVVPTGFSIVKKFPCDVPHFDKKRS